MFEWDQAKSLEVRKNRGVGFEELLEAILTGHLIADLPHPIRKDQSLLIIQVKNYIWLVVIENRGEKKRIITAYPSRKYLKKIKGDKS